MTSGTVVVINLEVVFSMWGLFRLFLALTVVVSHARLIQGAATSAENPAFAAVEMFFAISGFVITRAIQSHYSSGARPLFRFWQNRALRLMPTYWTALAVGLACSSLPLGRFQVLGEPVGWHWLSQIFIIGQTGLINGRPGVDQPLDASWTLAIELVYYFVMSVWAARSRHNANVFLVATGLVALIAIIHVPSGDAYAGTLWEGLPFALGCYLAFLERPKVSALMAWAILAATCAYVWLAQGTAFDHYFAAVVACAAIIACESLPQRRLGRFMGDLSYPVYIIQFPAMALLSRLHGWSFVIAAPFAALAAGVVINRLVEAPLGRIRARIRTPGTARMTSPTQQRDAIPAPVSPTP